MPSCESRSLWENSLIKSFFYSIRFSTVGKDGRELYGVNEVGKEKALGLLAAAKSTEAVFLQKLGLWEGVTLKNLLKGFIEETNPGLPHPWESHEGES